MKFATLRPLALILAIVGVAGGEAAPSADPAQASWDPFAPMVRPQVPTGDGSGWVRNPIDAFIAAEHERLGLEPRPEAPRELLLRRVSLDLIGLPPSTSEQRDFLSDNSPDAYERVVDRLLASPHYGERWGRHWMDVWRYADRDRQEVHDGSEIPDDMWHWRDWIITSLNADKGYDAMLSEMLAGDELFPTDPARIRATGFLARNKASSHDIWMHTTVDHTMQAFAGLTIQCARCHNHPVDAITQREYYQLRAIFEPIAVRSEANQPIPRIFDANQNARTWLYLRGNELTPDKDNPIPPGVPALVTGPPFQIESISLPAGKTSSGRRKALAAWLCDPANPLTARVAVNHLWGRHFGTALVPTVHDFGKNGAPPTHPALLAWLATDLIEHGWQMKRLHRLIVTSATYRTTSTIASQPGESDRAARPDPDPDPDNHFLSRFPTRRMEAELVRDAILSISGRLDPTLGGPVLEAERGETELRRSLYFRQGPNTQMLFLTTFDGAVTQECYQRRPSVQPKQALALLNSNLVVQSARHLARDLQRESGAQDSAFVDAAFSNLLSRAATREEHSLATTYLVEQIELFATNEAAKRGTTADRDDLKRPSSDPALRARENLIHLLFNHHDFVTIR